MRAGPRFMAGFQQIRSFFSLSGGAPDKWPPWMRYAVAFLAVMLASWVRVLFYYGGAQLPYLCFYPAVVLVSLLLGRGPGVFAVVLSALSTVFWLEPVGTFSIQSIADELAVGLFVATGFLVVWVCERLRAARDRAERAEEELRVAYTKETSQLLENISDGFLSLDREWRFRYINPAAARLLDFPKEALAGKVIWEAFPDLETSSFGQAFRRAMSENAPMQVEDLYAPLNAWFDTRCYPSEKGLTIFFANLTESRQAKDALRREQEFTRALLENMVDGMVACDENFKLTLMNRAAREWFERVDFNVPAEQWPEFYQVYEEDGVTPMAIENVPLARAFRNETVRNVFMMIRATGRPPRYILANGTSFFDENNRKRGAVVVMHDVTEQKLAEEELYRLNRLYAVLSQVNQAVIRCSSQDELLRQICRVMVGFGGFKMAWIGKLDPVTKEVVPVASKGDEGNYLRKIKVYADERPEGLGPVGRSIRSGEPYISNDFPHDPDALPWREAALASGFRACISLPIRLQGSIFGALVVYSGELDFFHEKEIRLLEEVASDISFALDHLEHEIRRAQNEVALKQAKEAAEAASRAKDQFIAVLSHELRTPLTPVLTAVTLMETSRRWEGEDEEQLQMIRRNVELEAKLIDDLLDVTRISRGLIELHREELDAHACLWKALQICQAEIAAKGLDYEVKLEAADHMVWADAARMQQVFWNLIKNAVKFTPGGGRIEIRSANADGRLKIEVADTGVGIEPEVLPRIFNAFEQGEQTRSRRFGGLGLGLSIAKSVVELHQGTLTAFSEGPGKGACFTVELATIAPGHPAAPPIQTVAMPRGREQLKVLLVEDHPDTLGILSRLMQKWGYQVRCAEGVAQALEVAGREPFDILVSDIGLPDGNGLEIMRQLKARQGLRGIALSGFGTEADIRESRNAGFEEHLTKPVAVEALRTALDRLVTGNPPSA